MNYKINQVLAHGYILGEVFFVDITNKDVKALSTENEIKKLNNAITKSLDQISELKKNNKDLVDYLMIHEFMINDPKLKNDSIGLIRLGHTAEEAVRKVVSDITNDLISSKSGYLAERVPDLKDVENRIIYNMGEAKGVIEDDFILYMDTLYPSILINYRNKIKGIVVNQGGYTSHSAILCRQWDIPYVVIDAKLETGDKVIIDTGKKLVIKNPTEKVITAYKSAIKEKTAFEKKAVEHEGFLFLANVGSNLDLQRVKNYGFDAVGLYRTEMIFMNTDRPYTLEEQYSIYKEAVDIMSDSYIVFRTFDIGDDKQLSYVKSFRKGVDNYIHNPELFITQVKALLMANANNNVRIMFPMIETPQEFIFLKNWVLKIAKDHGYNIPKIGMMLETKKATFTIDEFTEPDFISIGTNDLTSELYHIDRGNAVDQSDKYIKDLLNHLRAVINHCEKYNICLSICGELASVPKAADLFYRIGVKNLSISPSCIQELNRAFTEFKKKKK